MPKRPQGQKRPADVIGNAVRVMRIATGEDQDVLPNANNKMTVEELGRKGELARAKSLSAKQRHMIAAKAASARWKKNPR